MEDDFHQGMESPDGELLKVSVQFIIIGELLDIASYHSTNAGPLWTRMCNGDWIISVIPIYCYLLMISF